MNPPEETPACRICGGAATLRYRGHPGYEAGTAFDLFACTGCRAVFTPTEAPTALLYERIYACADRLAGYERYARYACAVADHPEHPLDYLCEQEENYWAVAQLLRHRRGESRAPFRVLDVGCGLGYLTHALAADGFDATGCDVSAHAVAAARARFGDRYQHADAAQLAAAGVQGYDAVVLVEIVEHVFDIRALLDRLAGLVRPGGVLILTTPNRSFYPDWVLWETDLPPVHYWWLGEEAVVALGRRLGWRVEFVDFSRYYARYPGAIPLRIPRQAPTRGPLLSADGSVLSPVVPAGPPGRRAPRQHSPFMALLAARSRVLRDRWAGRLRCGARGHVLAAMLERSP